jgi:hypothetical protein
MNSWVVSGGTVLLLIGIIIFGLVYQRVSQLDSFAGQLARLMNPSLQNEYVMDQFYEIVFGLLAVGGLGFVIYGFVVKEKPVLTTSFAQSPPPSSGIRCSRCGRELPQGDLTFCPFCGSVLPAHVTL